ncbi:hypothetical protein CIHG_05152 [Coccidioides immitis H538.4]|uniref:Uncharacterized protein n=1 Tax=Coccidioides immitis H538.4 TaxID=396776 RepID=A0A0J8RQJ5_COCIT|nr:hypothetical protein CIHG_05152 [Coccidioides immitis H538.4]
MADDKVTDQGRKEGRAGKDGGESSGCGDRICRVQRDTFLFFAAAAAAPIPKCLRVRRGCMYGCLPVLSVCSSCCPSRPERLKDEGESEGKGRKESHVPRLACATRSGMTNTGLAFIFEP